MQPTHQRSHLIQQADTTLEKVTKRVHKEGPYIFVVLIKTQPTSLALWTLSALPLHPRHTQGVLTVATSNALPIFQGNIMALRIQAGNHN